MIMTSHFSIKTNMSLIPKLSPKDLEAVLDILPETDYHVGFRIDYGLRRVDFSALEKQIHKDNPCTEGLNFGMPGATFFDYIPRENLVQLYRSQYEWGELLSGERTKDKVDKFMATRENLRLKIDTIKWDWIGPGNKENEWVPKLGIEALGIEIDVTPGGVYVNYSNEEEPKIVGKLREALKDSEAQVFTQAYKEGTRVINYTLIPSEP